MRSTFLFRHFFFNQWWKFFTRITPSSVLLEERENSSKVWMYSDFTLTQWVDRNNVPQVVRIRLSMRMDNVDISLVSVLFMLQSKEEKTQRLMKFSFFALFFLSFLDITKRIMLQWNMFSWILDEFFFSHFPFFALSHSLFMLFLMMWINNFDNQFFSHFLQVLFVSFSSHM